MWNGHQVAVVIYVYDNMKTDMRRTVEVTIFQSSLWLVPVFVVISS